MSDESPSPSSPPSAEELLARAVAAWDGVPAALERKIERRNVDNFIRPLKLVSFDGVKLTLGAPAAFNREWVERKYKAAIGEAFGKRLDVDEKIAVRIVLQTAEKELSPAPKNGGPGTPLPPVMGERTGPVTDEEFERIHGRPPLTDEQLAGALGATSTSTAAALTPIVPNVERMARAQARLDAQRYELPDFLNFSIEMAYPLRVLREPKDKDGNKLGPQMFWCGLNGYIVQAIAGGYDAEGRPLGIPGHSLPLAMNMYLATEMLKPRDPLTNPDLFLVGLGADGDGCYLPKLSARLGFTGNVRGSTYLSPSGRLTAAGRMRDRIEQYCACTHRIMQFGSYDDAKRAYKRLLEIKTLPPMGELGGRDLDVTPVREYEIWGRDQLGDEAGRGVRSTLTLTEEYCAYHVEGAVPMPVELVTKIIRYPQALVLAAIISKHLYALMMSGKRQQRLEWSSLQDQMGQNGADENRRPVHSRSIFEARVVPAWTSAANELNRPLSKLSYECVEASGRREAALILYPSPLLMEKGSK